MAWDRPLNSHGKTSGRAIMGALNATVPLIAVAIIYGLGLAYYFFYLRSRREAMAALREPQLTD